MPEIRVDFIRKISLNVEGVICMKTDWKKVAQEDGTKQLVLKGEFGLFDEML